MSDFAPYKDRIIKFLNAEIAESEFKLSELDKQGRKDKYIESYLSMVKNIVKYIDKNTKTGIFVGLEYSIVDKHLFELADRANALLESKEWTKYLKFFLNGRTAKYDIKPTPEGSAVWNRKRYQKIEDAETEKCTRLYHKLKVLVEDFNLEKFPNEALSENNSVIQKATRKQKKQPQKEEKSPSWQLIY